MYDLAELQEQYETQCRAQRMKNLKYLREEIANKSLLKFAKEIGIQSSNLSNIENGKRDLSLLNIQAYRAYFRDNFNLNLSSDFLLGYTSHIENGNMNLEKETGLSEKSINSLRKLNKTFTTTRPIQTLNLLLEDTFNAGALLNNISLFIGNNEEWTQSIGNLETFDEETQVIQYRDISENECFAIHSSDGMLALNKDDLIDALSFRQINRTLNKYKDANTLKKGK